MRALTPTEAPEIALERAQIIVERLNLPSNAASKFAKALTSYSKKERKISEGMYFYILIYHYFSYVSRIALPSKMLTI